MPRKYRHIKEYEKKLIEYKTGNRPLFCPVLPCFMPIRLFLTVCTIRRSSPNAVCFFTIMPW